MKDLHIWSGLCGIFSTIAFFTLIGWLQGDYDPLWIEVAGTTLGFALVISFERVFTLIGQLQRGNNLAHELGKELIFCLWTLENDKLDRATTKVWEMGLSTGDIGLIESSKRGQFDTVYEVITRRNMLVDRYDTARIMSGTDTDALEELRVLIADDFTKVILEVIPQTLKETMTKEWMKKFYEVDRARKKN